MKTTCLEKEVGESTPKKTANEISYLSSIMPEARQEGYTCVTGCSDCASCGGNDYSPRK